MAVSARANTWLFFKQRPYYIIMYVLMASFYPVRHVVVPFYLGKVTTQINKPITPENGEALRRVAKILVTLWSLALLFQIGRSLLDSYAVPLLSDFVRNSAIDGILQTYRRNFKELQTGDLNVKLYQMPESVSWEFKYLMNNLFPALLTLLVASYFFFKANPTFGIVYMVFLILFGILMYAMYVVLKRDWSETQREVQTLHEQIDDFLVNLFSMYVTGSVDFEQTRLKHFNQRVIDQWTRASVHRSVFRAFATFLKYSFLASMVGAAYLLRRTNTIADVAPIIFMAVTIENMLYETTVNFVDMTFYTGDIERMEGYLRDIDKDNVKAPPKNRLENIVVRGNVEFSTVGLTYPGASEPVFQHVNLSVAHKDRILITGHIGAGKSTLTKLLVGLHPYTGSIKIDGFEVRDMSSAELHRAVTFVPQSPRLFNRTVYENISYGLGEAFNRAQIERVVASLEIPRFPSLDAMSGKNGSALSGGQRTIVYLIRAFLKRTPIVVLDEPTAALDPETKEVVRRVVGQLFVDQTVMVITHDFSVDWKPTQRWKVADGKVTVSDPKGAIAGVV
jgi:ABC-type multidrug transport system fused ATPase/permease subunit